MIIEISVAVIAIAFVVLVAYLITMIKALRITLNQVNQTLVETRRQLDEVGGQVQKMIEHTNQISFDLKQKVEALNPIFKSAANVGEILERKTFSLKKEAFASIDEERYRSSLDTEEKKRVLRLGH